LSDWCLAILFFTIGFWRTILLFLILALFFFLGYMLDKGGPEGFGTFSTNCFPGFITHEQNDRARSRDDDALFQSVSGEDTPERVCEKAESLGALDAEDLLYVSQMLEGVGAHTAQIDELVSRYSKDWPIERISRVDLSILRVAIYEMLYRKEDVPTGARHQRGGGAGQAIRRRAVLCICQRHSGQRRKRDRVPMNRLYLGVDTSNYTTSVSCVSDEGIVSSRERCFLYRWASGDCGRATRSFSM
jgi:transcription termination factor NusB